jgi:hypothetical protein
MSNDLLVINCSALPAKVKRTTHTQEDVRVLRSCRRDMAWEEKAKHLSSLIWISCQLQRRNPEGSNKNLQQNAGI